MLNFFSLALLLALLSWTPSAFAANAQISTCAAWPAQKGMLCADTFKDEHGAVRTEWYFQTFKKVRKNLPGFEVSMSMVGSLNISKNGRYLGVLSGAEGVAYVDLFRLPAKLGAKPGKALAAVSAYPGGVDFAKPAWKGDELIVESDTDLTSSAEPKPSLEKARAFAISAAGKVRALPATAATKSAKIK